VPEFRRNQSDWATILREMATASTRGSWAQAGRALLLAGAAALAALPAGVGAVGAPITIVPLSLPGGGAGAAPATVPLWGVLELVQAGVVDSPAFNAFAVVANATFTHAGTGASLTAVSFYDGADATGRAGVWRTRFSPPAQGAWAFTTAAPPSAGLPPQAGGFTVTPPAAGDHGPPGVSPTNPRALAFADGTPYFSVGSTSYAWLHIGDANANATLASLAGAPFNKLRMTLTPKFYPWTHLEPSPAGFFAFPQVAPLSPPCTVCCPSQNGSFDVTRFWVPFWRDVEARVATMAALGVVADLILFHPYDGGHWGLDCNPEPVDHAYVRYAAARLSAFSNVWWSMANEWSLLKCKCAGGNKTDCPQAYFDRLFGTLVASDPHGRMRSIHNGPIYYNYSRPWITHVSMQCHDANCVDTAVASWVPRPVVMDEVRYEGNISASWGQLTGEQMAQRFWMYLAKGAYAGHSECLQPAVADAACDPDPNNCACSPNMWWNHGGHLTSTASPALLRFFRAYVDALPVPFSGLASVTVAPGVYWLRPPPAADPRAAFSFVLWDETVLNATVPVTLPLPAGAAYAARRVDYASGSFHDLGTLTGPVAFTPPTPGYALELRAT
jgi:hypothetical protein